MEKGINSLLRLYYDAINGVKFQFKYYTGNGTSRQSSNPASLTFDFAPTVILFVGYTDNKDGSRFQDAIKFSTYMGSAAYPGADMTKLTTSYLYCDMMTASMNSSSVKIMVKKSSDGKTIYWYANTNTDSGNVTLNYSGYTYYFLAIG